MCRPLNDMWKLKCLLLQFFNLSAIPPGCGICAQQFGHIQSGLACSLLEQRCRQQHSG